MSCEPPTPEPSTKSFFAYTRERNLQDWSTRISTLNVWDLPVVSKFKDERMPEIGLAVQKRSLDFVMLEEAWLQSGRNQIFDYSLMPYRHDVTFKGAPLASGLMYLSHTQLLDVSFRPFQLFGPVALPDAWAVKGAGMVTTEIRNLPISFFSTHLMAGLPRFKNSRSPFTPEWKAEMFELIAHVIEQSQSDAFIIAGDFNIHFGDEEYFFWKELTSLEGTFLEEANGTCTWCKDNVFAKILPKQIDYIFVSPRLKIADVKVDYKDKVIIKWKHRNLSDHYGLTAKIEVIHGDSLREPNQVREKFISKLEDLRNELQEYHHTVLEKPEEQSLRAEIETKGLETRLCLSCRIEVTLKMIDDYERALSLQANELTQRQFYLQRRLDSYFDTFK